MKDYLKSIGFYTLNDERAKNIGIDKPLSRCELILTDKCTFKCPYCRRNAGYDVNKSIPYADAERTVRLWASEGLKNIRFSGGEPTIYKGLKDLVSLSKELGVERIAISTNGSARPEYYMDLVEAGVNDFSISLDGCNPEYVKKMSGGLDVWDRLIGNIQMLSKVTYVTVGMVFNEQNIHQAKESVLFAANLGVSDIRVLSSAQYNQALDVLKDLPEDLLDRFPILKFRINNFRNGIGVRGLSKSDSNRCRLVLDDMAVAGGYHFPCIIALREGMAPIGKVGPNMRQERLEWCNSHDTHKNSTCWKQCLEVCRLYNNIADLAINK